MRAPGDVTGPGARAGADEHAVFVGLDLGTSSLKGVALDARGRVLADVRETYDTARPTPGRAEQDPADWTAAAQAALAALAAAVPATRWRCLGLSGMIPTLVTLDESLRPLGAAFSWEDCRAQAEAAEIVEEIGEAALYESTGQPLDGRYLLPMYAWIRRNDPDRAARTAVVLGAKDYLFACLTGEFLTDPSTATGYGCYDLVDATWLRRVAALAAVSTTEQKPGLPGLPAVVPSSQTRPLRAEMSDLLGLPSGLPVTVGAADSVLAGLALSAVTPGSVAYVWGTSTVVLGAGAERPVDPERLCLITPLATAGWGAEMDLVSTGAAVGWLSRLLGYGATGQAHVFEVAASAPDTLVPAALPFVAVGEQGALWDNDVRGTLLGLDLSHSQADVARAVLDGIILESRRCLARLRDLGLPAGDVYVATQYPDRWFFQRLADASGRRVIVGDPRETSSAAGAARLAAHAQGTVVPQSSATVLDLAPDPVRGQAWRRRWAEYQSLLAPLRRLYRTWPRRDDD